MMFSKQHILATALTVCGLSFALSVEQAPLKQAAVSRESYPDIPLLGFGTWNLPKSNASDIVSTALQTGYRHIDCAKAYGNQEEVGKGLKAGLDRVGLKREEIWVTSKLWNNAHAPAQVPLALEQTLKELDLDYLDLYLMHWPVADNDGKYSIDFVDTWKAMTLLLASGKVKHIGVCNFSPSQLRELLDSTAGRVSRPYAHQYEQHPYLPQWEFLEWHQTYGIHATSYSPLGGTNPTYEPGKDVVPLLENKLVHEIAEKRGCTPAQVALKWGLLRRTSVIPKSTKASRIEENFEATKCELHWRDLAALRKELPVKRYSNPSKRWGVSLFDGLQDAGFGVSEIFEEMGRLSGEAASLFHDLKEKMSS